jgi:ketosteroid isomerase-like protein
MIVLNLRAALLVIVTVLLAPAATYAAAMDEQVKAANAAWDAAFNKGDPAAVAAFYADDAKLLPPDHAVYEGPAGAEKFFAGVIGSGVTGHKLEIIEADGGDTLVAAAAKWSAQGKDASGKPATFGGVATHVFEKQADGSLKL